MRRGKLSVVRISRPLGLSTRRISATARPSSATCSRAELHTTTSNELSANGRCVASPPIHLMSCVSLSLAPTSASTSMSTAITRKPRKASCTANSPLPAARSSARPRRRPSQRVTILNSIARLNRRDPNSQDVTPGLTRLVREYPSGMSEMTGAYFCWSCGSLVNELPEPQLQAEPLPDQQREIAGAADVCLEGGAHFLHVHDAALRDRCRAKKVAGRVALDRTQPRSDRRRIALLVAAIQDGARDALPRHRLSQHVLLHTVANLQRRRHLHGEL